MKFSQSVSRAFFKSLLLLFPIALLLTWESQAQGSHLLDSLQKNLASAQTNDQKLFALDDMASFYRASNPKLSDSFSRQSIEIAELSRDRRLIVRAYLMDGQRRLGMASVDGYIAQAMDDFRNAERVARDNGLNEELGFAEIGLARVIRVNGNYEQALNYNQQAISIAAATHNDSLKVIAYNSLAITYRYRNEKMLAFRTLLEALDIAEQSANPTLTRSCYLNISDFYSLIDDNDKAIDYMMKAKVLDEKKSAPDDLLDDYDKIGKLFVKTEQHDLALSVFNKALALADSLQYYDAKQEAMLAIVNMYINSHETRKGMDYFNAHPELKDYFVKAGISEYLDEGYGTMYTELHRFDSALYFYRKAEPVIEKGRIPFRKVTFYQEFGNFFKEKGDYPNAIAYYLKTHGMGEDMKDLDILQNSSKELDSLYSRTGDFKTAYFYNQEYNRYKDSIRSLAKETDLLKLEVDNDNRRRERLAKEEEENTNRRHNIQYMGLTVGLFCLFVILVMLGLFMVSPRTIRALGFFTFIFLFEFVIMLAEHPMHEWTHGEPWMMLLFKILLAAVLLPLHHWLEHKVIHYLNSHKKISPEGLPFFGRKNKKLEEGPVTVSPAEQG